MSKCVTGKQCVDSKDNSKPVSRLRQSLRNKSYGEVVQRTRDTDRKVQEACDANRNDTLRQSALVNAGYHQEDINVSVVTMC